MRLLIDTQVLLWALYCPERLSLPLQERLAARHNEVFFSAVSIAEIALKTSLGHEDFSFDPQEILQAALESDFAELPLSAQQALHLARLPRHHRDPFDRLLVAQAIEEGLRLITTDRQLARYSELVEVQ